MLRATRLLSRRQPTLNNLASNMAVRSMSSAPKFTGKLACLDLEGVLIPEVWVNLAEEPGVEDAQADDARRARVREADATGSTLWRRRASP